MFSDTRVTEKAVESLADLATKHYEAEEYAQMHEVTKKVFKLHLQTPVSAHYIVKLSFLAAISKVPHNPEWSKAIFESCVLLCDAAMEQAEEEGRMADPRYGWFKRLAEGAVQLVGFEGGYVRFEAFRGDAGSSEGREDSDDSAESHDTTGTEMTKVSHSFSKHRATINTPAKAIGGRRLRIDVQAANRILRHDLGLPRRQLK